MHSRVWAVIALATTSGCGGPSPDLADGGNTHGGGSSSGGGLGSATVNGTIGGKTFTPVDAASYYGDDALFHFIFYDAPGVCGDYLLGGNARRNSSVLLFTIQDATVGRPEGSDVAFVQLDATCHAPSGVEGSGPVTLTAVSASSISGDFSFTLNTDTITGSFVAPTCAGAPGTHAGICE
jgi:hypothetical protein